MKLEEAKTAIIHSGLMLGFLTENDIVEIDRYGNVLKKSNGMKTSSETVDAVIHAYCPYYIGLSMLDEDCLNNFIFTYSRPASNYRNCSAFTKKS